MFFKTSNFPNSLFGFHKISSLQDLDLRGLSDYQKLIVLTRFVINVIKKEKLNTVCNIILSKSH